MGLFDGTKWQNASQCQVCGNSVSDCSCPSDLLGTTDSGEGDGGETSRSQWKLPEKQTARVRVEKRKAKRVVTVITGLSATESDLPGLLSKLKGACGAGGALEEENLVIQGDQAERAAAVLRQIGYRVKP